MFKRILLPVDLTARHGRALEVAADLAGPTGAEVILLHVIETLAGRTLDEERAFYGRLERSAQDHLSQVGQALGRRKVTWRADVRYGKRALECVRYAQEAAADLIVLTAPRLDPTLPGPDWGSLSYKIGVLSQCPVLLVK
jgi:universal stress protein A